MTKTCPDNNNNNHDPATKQHHHHPKNLFDYTAEELKSWTHYEILHVEPHISTDGIKKVYRKASLKYHPDKTGRADDDYVFLAIKAAYDVLSDPAARQAYDSTAIPFDDSIPPNRNTLLQDPFLLYKDEDFYDTFGPVFRRNLRFDARLRPDASTNNSTGTKNGRNNKTKVNKTHPPDLGDESTPIEQVHKFYEYWVHFESWRDFSMQAADELELEQTLENAESRYEKRFYQKEIDKRAKQLKKVEMNRIQTLVERAMEADPRLRKERAEALAAKERAQQERLQQKQRQIDAQKEAERLKQIEAEQLQKQMAEQKAKREQEKKLIRSQRQLLRRMTSASFEDKVNSNNNNQNDNNKSEIDSSCCYQDAYDMNQDVDFLCQNLDFEQLSNLNKTVQEHSSQGGNVLEWIQQKVKELKLQQQEQEVNTISKSNPSSSNDNGDDNKAATRTSTPWSKEQLSALAKAVKKYPPGSGATRWDQICQFVNHICKDSTPHTKEECIEKYNQVARRSNTTTANVSSTPAAQQTVISTTSTVEDTTAATEDNSASWSSEQDQQLQDALSKFPATMEKNERWTAIAKDVQGKTKKECVQRFKAIREAIKAKENKG